MKYQELTKDEKKLINKIRRQREQTANENKPKRIAFLKEAIYTFWGDDYGPSDWIFSPSEKDQEIKEFEKRFKLACPAGTKFVCYMRGNKEEWYDDIKFGIEAMNAKWAKKYLHNFQDADK